MYTVPTYPLECCVFNFYSLLSLETMRDCRHEKEKITELREHVKIIDEVNLFENGLSIIIVFLEERELNYG